LQKKLIVRIMKKIVLLLLFVSAIAVGQCVNGTTTNPLAPTNPAFPNYLNHFNWENSPVFKYNVPVQPNSFTPNPFFSNQPEFQNIALQQDFKSVNGWEAIAYNLGYDNNNNALQAPKAQTYFLLYNKYRGILRVLVKWSDVKEFATNAQLTLKFAPGFQTNLLDMTTDEKPLLAPHIPNAKYTANLTYFNDSSSWSYADFKVNYDPCTCNFTESARLQLYTNLIQNSTINLTGAINGTITTITNGQSTGTNDSSGKFWNDLNGQTTKFVSARNKIQGFVDDNKKIYDKLKDGGVTINAITKLGDFMKTNSFMKAGLAATPYVGDAVKFMSSIFGGGGGATGPLELAPLSVNLAVKLNGTVSLSAPMHNFTIGLPGAQTSASLLGIYGGQPLYNEPMGVFSLIDEPTMYYTETVTTQNEARYGLYKNFYVTKTENVSPFIITRRNYSMSAKYLRYAINPASNLELKDAEFMIVAEYVKPSLTFVDRPNNGYGFGTNPNVEKDPENGLPINLIGFDSNPWPPSPFPGGQIVYAPSSIGNVIDRENKIFQNAFPSIGMNYFSNGYSFDFIYDIKKSRENSYYNTDYGILSEKTTYAPNRAIENVTFTPKPEYLEPRVKSFKLKIILNLKRTDNPNAQNVLYVVTYPIKLIAGANPNPQFTVPFAVSANNYKKNSPYITVPKFIRVQDAITLNGVCGSSEYRSNRIQTAKNTQDKTIITENELQSNDLVYYPNPLERTLHIKLNKTKITSVVGIDGKSLNAFDLESINKLEETELDFTSYPKGIYFINYVDSDNNSKTAKIIKD
jgi:Secretion system C-terminal sorting domain